MAVRFIQPIDTPYESQFVPMPLDFMYKNLQEKQKGLDESRAAIAKIDPKINYAPWDEALAQQYKERFAQEARDLAANLEQNKDDYSSVVSRVGELNRRFTTDPELSRILRHAEAWKTNVEPSLKNPEAATAYFATLKNPDGTWKSGNQIKDEDIVAPIFNKVEAQVDKELLPFLTESVREVYKDAVPQINPNTGQIEYVRPDGVKITDLNLDNPFILDAIDKYSKRWLEGNEAQHLYLKEKLGINTFEGIRDFMRGIASKKFFSKTDVLPGSPVSSGGNSRGGNSNLPEKDIAYSINQFNSQENIIDIRLEELNEDAKKLQILEQEQNQVIFDALSAARLDLDMHETIGTALKYSGIVTSFKGKDTQFDENIRKALKGVDLPENEKRKVEEILGRSTSGLDLITTYGMGIFDVNSPVYQQLNINPQQALQIKKAVNASLVGLNSKAGSDEENDFLNQINELTTKYQSEAEIYRQKELLFDASVDAAAQNLNLPNQEVSNLVRGYNIYQTLKDEYTTLGMNLGISQNQIKEDPRLQQLVDLGFLIPNSKQSSQSQNARALNEGFIGTSVRLLNNNSYSFNTDLVLEAGKVVPVVQEEYNKKYTETVHTITEIGNTNGILSSAVKSYVTRLNNNPDLILQLATATAAGDGKSPLNKGSVAELFDSSKLKRKQFNPKLGIEVTDVAFRVDNLGLPRMFITAANDPKNPETFSTIEVQMEESNSGLVSSMINAFKEDDDPKVREVGDAWLATRSLSPSSLSLAALYFNSTIPESKKSFEPISIESKSGNTYTLIHLATGTTKLQINGRNAEEIRTETDVRINPTDIKNYQTFLQYVANYELHGSRGGASNPQNFQRPQNGERR